MLRLIALFAFVLSSSVIADEGQVAIRCDADGTGGLERIEFIETDLKGQYIMAQVFEHRSPVMISNAEGLWLTTSEEQIRESESQLEGVEFAMESIWGNPTVLRMRGEKNMSVIVKDCQELAVRLSCQRL